jgi:hypothetical protein
MFRVDASRPEDVDRLVTHTVEWFGHVDTRIANAGGSSITLPRDGTAHATAARRCAAERWL